MGAMDEIAPDDIEALRKILARSAACEDLDVEPALLQSLVQRGYLSIPYYSLTTKAFGALDVADAAASVERA